MGEKLTTWNEMLARVRRSAKDEAGAVWPEATAKAVVFEAVLDLARDCPDALLGERGRMTPLPPEVLDWNQHLPTAPFYDAAVEALAVYKLAVSDAADVKDESLARHWLGRYQQLTRGG
ncbi:MAG: hypothetical protein IK066_04530 [Kiritimatiellae bacterium]|nr:hypothetical protein [Kiritimatiellia bacterium]